MRRPSKRDTDLQLAAVQAELQDTQERLGAERVVTIASEAALTEAEGQMYHFGATDAQLAPIRDALALCRSVIGGGSDV